MRYRRVLLKISGEALAGKNKTGIDQETLRDFSRQVLEVKNEGGQVALVIGGGNIHRGLPASEGGMDRTSSDHMGMLATVINSLAFQDALERIGVVTRVMTAIDMQEIAEPYIRRRAIRHLERDRVVIFAAGTGNPYFTTDTAAALRANEIDAEVLLKATKVDGIYDKDPLLQKDALKFSELSYLDVLKNRIRVMDATAVSMCMDNSLDVIVFNVFEQNSILRCMRGERVGTIITST